MEAVPAGLMVRRWIIVVDSKFEMENGIERMEPRLVGLGRDLQAVNESCTVELLSNVNDNVGLQLVVGADLCVCCVQVDVVSNPNHFIENHIVDLYRAQRTRQFR